MASVTSVGSQSWLNRFARKPLPVLPGRGECFAALLADDTLSLKQLARQIGADPVLSLHVWRAAQKVFMANKSRKDQAPLGHIEHCVTLLGQSALERLASQLPKGGYCLDGRQGSFHQSLGLLQALNHSLYAASLASWLAEKKGWKNREQAYVHGLLFGVPVWLLWFHSHPLLLTLLEAQQRAPGNRLSLNDAIVKETLEQQQGVTLARYSADIYTQWHLPEGLQQLQEIAPGELAREMVKLARARVRTWQPAPGSLFARYRMTMHTLLANWLATETGYDWSSRRARLALRAAARYCGQEENTFRDQLIQQALQFSRRVGLPVVAQPASALMQDGSARQAMDFMMAGKLVNQGVATPESLSSSHRAENAEPERPGKSQKAKKVTAEKGAGEKAAGKTGAAGEVGEVEGKAKTPLEKQSAEEPVLDDQPVINARMVANTLEKLASENPGSQQEIFQDLIFTLAKGAGFNHVMLLARKKGMASLVPAITNTPAKRAGLDTLYFDASKRSLFAQLLEKPQTLLVNARNKDKIARGLPAGFLDRWDAQLLMQPLVINGKVRAMVLADSPVSVSDEQLRIFRNLCVSVIKALQHQAKQHGQARSRENPVGVASATRRKTPSQTARRA